MISAELILNIIEASVVTTGACWAYYRFFSEGVHRHKMQFSIDCKFLGPQKGFYLAEFKIVALNKGLILHQFPSIILRVRGIKHDEELQQWHGKEPRLYFGTKLFETEIIPARFNYIFVESGIEQTITYVTPIPECYRFLSAQAEFKYDRWTPHSTEGVFELPTKNESSVVDKRRQ